jgi:hypothetical protein
MATLAVQVVVVLILQAQAAQEQAVKVLLAALVLEQALIT